MAKHIGPASWPRRLRTDHADGNSIGADGSSIEADGSSIGADGSSIGADGSSIGADGSLSAVAQKYFCGC